jgi:hypothetical protein
LLHQLGPRRGRCRSCWRAIARRRSTARVGVASTTIVRPRLLVIDTSQGSAIDGEGNDRHRHEKYALVLKANSKQFSMFALRGPM